MARDTLQGTLDILVLKTLARGPEHGYGITCHILNASDQHLRVEEGSLYPALRRMETAGLIKAEWKASENNRKARFYELSRRGREQLRAEVTTWERYVRAVSKALAAASPLPA